MQTRAWARCIAETETIADTVTHASRGAIRRDHIDRARRVAHADQNCCLSGHIGHRLRRCRSAHGRFSSSRFGGAAAGFRFDAHDVREVGRLSHKIERTVPVEIAVDGREVGIRRRLRTTGNVRRGRVSEFSKSRAKANNLRRSSATQSSLTL